MRDLYSVVFSIKTKAEKKNILITRQSRFACENNRDEIYLKLATENNLN